MLGNINSRRGSVRRVRAFRAKLAASRADCHDVEERLLLLQVSSRSLDEEVARGGVLLLVHADDSAAISSCPDVMGGQGREDQEHSAGTHVAAAGGEGRRWGTLSV